MGMTKADQARAIFNSRREASQQLNEGMTGVKRCSVCGLIKNIALEFYPRTAGDDKARPYCIMCDNALRTQYNQENR